MNLLTQQRITTRDLTHNYAKIKKDKKLTIIMSGSRPSSIMLPFDEIFVDLLRPFVKKTKSQLLAEKALQEYKRGNTKAASELRKKYA
jgi:hypothetical protein